MRVFFIRPTQGPYILQLCIGPSYFWGVWSLLTPLISHTEQQSNGPAFPSLCFCSARLVIAYDTHDPEVLFHTPDSNPMNSAVRRSVVWNSVFLSYNNKCIGDDTKRKPPLVKAQTAFFLSYSVLANGHRLRRTPSTPLCLPENLISKHTPLKPNNDRASLGLEPRLADHRSQAARTATLPTAPPRQVSPNCIKKTKINKIWRKTSFNMADGILTPAMWHDHDIDFARWLHRTMWRVALRTVNSPSGSRPILQRDTWLWNDMPLKLNSPKRPPYRNSTSGFDFGHITAVNMSFCTNPRNFYPNRTTVGRKNDVMSIRHLGF